MCGHLPVNLSCNELLYLELASHVEIERLDVSEANLENLFLSQKHIAQAHSKVMQRFSSETV